MNDILIEHDGDVTIVTLNRPEDRAVYYYVRHGDAPLDTRILTDYERGRQVVSRAHIANDLTIYSQSTGKGDVTQLL